MDSAESNNGKTNESLYYGIWMEKIYHLMFDDDQYVDGAALPYGQEINDQNTEESNETCV